MDWSVYIILCSDGSLYTGISTDVERRFLQHLNGKGAKFFRGRQPLNVAYRETNYSRADACRRESAIKKMRRAEKWALIQQNRLLLRDGVMPPSS
ncbi:GIY-YIG nuclease family protein [Methylomonas sp. SURF-2]|uniref:GIY-YIG nuclease family protein n=1 Tax=Methylomonas subterranea TaxID=2952225 RepID=A0ABT1TLG3_9GAMM|nr:GIY-YIG nuclease family protein [Methylomonas sp. SURF-2]MCQ8106312.1 GIY-YIG nuclease family protein [Methylomonas sp. SURF-2]